MHQESLYLGPLPPPSDLERYAQIIPDGAERIMRLVEARTAHDMGLERTALGEAIQIARRGQILALAMGLATLTGSLAAAITGHDGAAITLAATSLLGVVAAFLGVRLGSKPERRGVSP